MDEAIRNYCFSLRELRELRTAHGADNTDEFLSLLEVWARNKIETGSSFSRQADRESKLERSADD
jgi:hypothetical protein